MPFQPTILVKKADGSQVRMTMDEFNDYIRTTKDAKLSRQSGIPSSIAGRTANDKAGQREVLPAKVGTEALATSAPVKDVFIDEAKAKEAGFPLEKIQQYRQAEKKPLPPPLWTVGDKVSPLEENLTEKHEAEHVLPAGRPDEISRVIGNLKFLVSDELTSRLRFLVLSRLKGVRSDEQVSEYARREQDKGGLGWSQEQADVLLAALRETLPLPAAKFGQKTVPLLPAAAAVAPDKPTVRPFKNGALMRDVIAPARPEAPLEKTTFGPLEEMRAMNLTDFRRLANNPDQAGETLKNKFAVLKQESFVLYLKAIAVWRESPLYGQYQAVIKTALGQQRPISAVLSGRRDGLTEAEFKALVELGKNLNV